MNILLLLLFIFVIAAFLGKELISKIPSQLHTPLMSATNAISGITVAGALVVFATQEPGTLGMILSFIAIIFAIIIAFIIALPYISQLFGWIV